MMDLKAEIVLAKQRELDKHEAALAETINAQVPAVQLDTETITLLAPFAEFCSVGCLRQVPAKPQTVAAYIWHQLSRGTEHPIILYQISAIERLHDHYGIANPVATVSARYALLQITKVDPPRSWTKDEQALFATLTVEIQGAIARREASRETWVRRKQNELADEKKRHQQQVAEEKEPVETKEATNG